MAILRNFLYLISMGCLIGACYLGYQWYISEPQNKEPLPALLSFMSAFFSLLAGWGTHKKSTPKDNENPSPDDGKNNVKVTKTDKNSNIVIDPNEKTNYDVSKTKDSTILIGKGALEVYKSKSKDKPNSSKS